MSRTSHCLPDASVPRASAQPQLTRLAETARTPVMFYLDGAPVQALAGDTLLTAILTHQRHLRFSEFSGAPRAGFCLIGACQDCWVRCETLGEVTGDAQRTRVRACSTTVQAGMRILTDAPGAPHAGDDQGGTHG